MDNQAFIVQESDYLNSSHAPVDSEAYILLNIVVVLVSVVVFWVGVIGLFIATCRWMLGQWREIRAKQRGGQGAITTIDNSNGKPKADG